MEAINKKVSIYTSHHKPSAFLSSDIIKPIHVGKANSHNDICCDGDDSGDNISYKNPFYCELTAQYWVWKNEVLTDYVGFMHYRRHLNFSNNQSYEEDVWGVVNEDVISSQYEEKYGLDELSLTNAIKGCDVILPKKWSVKQAGSKNNYEHYKNSAHLHIEDYSNAIISLLKLYPEYESAVDEFNKASDGYYTNMFVMKRELFIEYSQWLFSVLEDFEKDFALKNYTTQEKRVIGHISERLLNIFIIYKERTKKIIKKELQRTFIKNETFNGKLSPAFNEKNVPVVICFDDNYALSAGALVNSISKNSTDEKNYDIVILENNVSEKNKARLISLVKEKKNFKIRFFDVNSFSEMKSVYTRAHFSAATYARLFIPSLFSDFEKVVFIDADTIVEHDISELLNINLGNELVAAVKDIVMEGFVKFGALTHIEGESKNITAENYLKNVLDMKDTQKYFQAGILVFNIKQMNAENTFAALMKGMKARKYWFLDQDIMNMVFYERVFYLPMEWNVYHGNGNTDDFFPNLNFSTYMRFLESRKRPKMIHFAGENKPWDTTSVDFSENFISYISDTPWNKELFDRLNGIKYSLSSNSDNKKVLFQTKVKRKVMPYLNKFAPVGSKRRQMIARNYYKFRKIILG
ncbi:DUF4422 domain-containing protein [Pantoea dispersa]|uniref:DUF4422 domain-containing protein n=1 Tax=Pantoea dispersa TaxID=59814 RepID=UPI0021B030A8|nr:DUF4422 domain-containing protein [Pantoea dispersa]MCT6588740.1 DUF4422 domain-containing protein [Pantoea dispersa]MDI6636873.1 DUF4422 domain-containing protein [Pantoea dispersa]